MSTGTIHVIFSGPKPKTKLDIFECLDKHEEIKTEFQVKISQLDKTEVNNELFIPKCKELRKYMNDKENEFIECFKGDLSYLLPNIETVLLDIINKSTKYGHCEAKLKPEKKDQCNVGDDGCHEQTMPIGKGSEEKSACPDDSCKKDHSECHRSIDKKHASGSIDKTTCQAYNSESPKEPGYSRNFKGDIPPESKNETHFLDTEKMEETFQYFVPTLDNKKKDKTDTYISILQDNASLDYNPNNKSYTSGLDMNNLSRIDVIGSFFSTEERAIPLTEMNYIHSETSEGESGRNIFHTTSHSDINSSPTQSLSGEKHATKEVLPVQELHDKVHVSPSQGPLSGKGDVSEHSSNLFSPLTTVDTMETCLSENTTVISGYDSHGKSTSICRSSSIVDEELNQEGGVEKGPNPLTPSPNEEGIPFKTYIIIIVVILAILLLLFLLFKFTALRGMFRKKKRKEKREIVEEFKKIILESSTAQQKSIYLAYGRVDP
ncbi:PIR Superfamily Protein [Plasmodium ovale wallikeri]|uniref:PIR Superfamily Protein n=1 Tax=Plasmodium ovale wallikeri TaxID=864142 RepID=A0A1A9AJI7_PLAOA|nr:PIR Superfamily Protein [Plasmodium ovale wallikeri]SBT59031.1 PIR Superfamily Protein [Plasmodium ovale wallikeri]